MHNITKNKHKTKQIKSFPEKNLANITPKFKTNKNDKCFNKKALMIMGRKMISALIKKHL